MAADSYHGLVVATCKARAVPTGHCALFGHIPGGTDDYIVPYNLYARQNDGAAVPQDDLPLRTPLMDV